MNSDSSKFEALKKLLILKSQETPPPGHFEYLSSQIIAQIEAEQVRNRDSWFQRFMEALDLKPVVACAYSLTTMGLLFTGLGLVQVLESDNDAEYSIGPGQLMAPAPSRLVNSSEPITQINGFGLFRAAYEPHQGFPSTEPIWGSVQPAFWVESSPMNTSAVFYHNSSY